MHQGILVRRRREENKICNPCLDTNFDRRLRAKHRKGWSGWKISKKVFAKLVTIASTKFQANASKLMYQKKQIFCKSI